MQKKHFYCLDYNILRIGLILLLFCNRVWSDLKKDYIQGGVDIIAASDENKPIIGWEVSFWRLNNIPNETYEQLNGYGYTIGVEVKGENLFFAQYNRIGYTYNEKFNISSIPIICLIGGGSAGLVMKMKEAGGLPNPGINLGWWNYFGVLGGISLEYKSFLNRKSIYSISFFHRIGLPTSWWIFPIR